MSSKENLKALFFIIFLLTLINIYIYYQILNSKILIIAGIIILISIISYLGFKFFSKKKFEFEDKNYIIEENKKLILEKNFSIHKKIIIFQVIIILILVLILFLKFKK